MNQVLEAKKIESMADVEIGHILVSSWGYDQTNIDYYKVIRKTAAMVELRAIGQNYVESASDMSEYVMPAPEKELFETDYMKRSEAEAKGFEIVNDHWCEGEIVNVRVPAISKHRAQFINGQLYVKIKGYRWASSWDGKRDFQSHWA
jgi:hypothetical protein